MRDKEGEMEATGCRKRERCWWNWGWERNGIAKRWERSKANNCNRQAGREAVERGSEEEAEAENLSSAEN